MNIEERLDHLEKQNRNLRRGPVGLLLLVLVVIALVVLVVVGGNKDHSEGGASRDSDRKIEQSPPKERTKPEPRKPTSKDDRFTIISDIGQPPQKRTVDVRLLREVSEEGLSTIAYKIKESDGRSYKRTFITYYLPWMAVGAGGWATTHFGLFHSPQVRIVTFTEMDKARASKKAKARASKKVNQPSDQVIGRWLDHGSFMGSITIYRQNGKLYLFQLFKDGTELKKEMTETSSVRGRRFDAKGGNRHGDHFIIQADGHLQIWDREGLMRFARKRGN